MALPAFPIEGEFYDWLDELPKHDAVFASAAVMEISAEGPYLSGCAELGGGVWSHTTALGSPNLHMLIYVYSDGERYFPLHGAITPIPDVRGEHLTEARRRLDRQRN